MSTDPSTQLCHRAAHRADARQARGGAARRADRSCTSRSGTDFARSSFAARPDVFIQSRDLRPLDRYFPELHAAFLSRLPDGCVVDGEIVIATPRGLDFDALQLRLHPAASRVAKLAKETPAEFVAFDLLAVGGRDVRSAAQGERRALLEELLAEVEPPLHLTPMTRDRAVAAEWLSRFEGAGLDGVIAKPEHGPYEPGKRAMIKVKHARTADCVVAGFRWHKAGTNELIGSLLLGLYDEERPAASRRRHVVVHDGDAQGAGRGAGAAAGARARPSPVARMGRGGRARDDADARRPEPLERRQGSLVGAAADRAGVRGQVRPHAGGSIPPRGGLSALAPRQAAGAIAATTSSRSRRLTSSRRCSARRGRVRPSGSTPLQSLGHVVVGIERFLRRPQRLRARAAG